MAAEAPKPNPKPQAPVKDIPKVTRDIVAGRRNGSYLTR